VVETGLHPARRGSLNPWLNVSTRFLVTIDDELLRNPITGAAGCCARAASGHTAAPLRSVMKSRRLMSDIGFLLLWRRRLVYRTLNLPQRDRQVLGVDLNCSESRRWAGPQNASSQTSRGEENDRPLS
jgi:hypothetical protein